MELHQTTEGIAVQLVICLLVFTTNPIGGNCKLRCFIYDFPIQLKTIGIQFNEDCAFAHKESNMVKALLKLEY